jgi:hypothetical protein
MASKKKNLSLVSDKPLEKALLNSGFRERIQAMKSSENEFMEIQSEWVRHYPQITKELQDHAETQTQLQMGIPIKSPIEMWHKAQTSLLPTTTATTNVLKKELSLERKYLKAVQTKLKELRNNYQTAIDATPIEWHKKFTKKNLDLTIRELERLEAKLRPSLEMQKYRLLSLESSNDTRPTPLKQIGAEKGTAQTINKNLVQQKIIRSGTDREFLANLTAGVLPDLTLSQYSRSIFTPNEQGERLQAMLVASAMITIIRRRELIKTSVPPEKTNALRRGLVAMEIEGTELADYIKQFKGREDVLYYKMTEQDHNPEATLLSNKAILAAKTAEFVGEFLEKQDLTMAQRTRLPLPPSFKNAGLQKEASLFLARMDSLGLRKDAEQILYQISPKEFGKTATQYSDFNKMTMPGAAFATGELMSKGSKALAPFLNRLRQVLQKEIGK